MLHGTVLQQLKLASNRLTSMPMEVSQLASLNTLVLDSNALTEVPKVSSAASGLLGLSWALSTWVL